MANGGLSLSNSSSTGATGNIIRFDSPVQTISAQAWTVAGTTAAGTFDVEVSINGRDWTTLIDGSTFGTAGTDSSTSANLITSARAVLATHTGGGPVNVTIVGK